MADLTDTPDVLGLEARVAIVGRAINQAQQAIIQAEITISVHEAGLDRLQKEYPDEWAELQRRLADGDGDDEAPGAVDSVAGGSNGVVDR